MYKEWLVKTLRKINLKNSKKEEKKFEFKSQSFIE